MASPGRSLTAEQLIEVLRLLNAIVGEGKDAMARIYVTLATRDRNRRDEQPPADSPAVGTGQQNRAGRYRPDRRGRPGRHRYPR